MYPVGVWFLAGIFTQRFRYSTTCDVFHFLTDKQVCISFFLNVIWWPDRVECVLPRAPGLLSLPFLFLTCDICAHIKGPGTIQGNKDPGKMLSQRKKSFTKISHAAGKKKKREQCLFLLLSVPVFLLLSFLLTVFDWIRQVNEKQHREDYWQPSPQPAPARVCAGVCAHTCPLTASGRLMSSGVPASQHRDETVREWWEAHP